MELEDKFHEATKAGETASLASNIAKAAWRKELKKKEGDEQSHKVAGTSKAAHYNACKKELEKAKQYESSQPVVMAMKTVLENARKTRGDVHRRADVL